MSDIMQFIEATFKPGVLVFVLANMVTLGLQAKIGDVVDTFKNKKAMALIVVWGFVFGPALAYLLTLVFPLSEPYVLAMFISSVAPMAPFFPLTVEKARGDVSFANAFVPVVIVGTVVFIPLIAPLVVEGLTAPLVVEGLTVSPLVLAKRLFFTLLLPLAIGAAFRHFAETVATKIFPAVNVITKIITAVMIVECLVIFGPPAVKMFGSFAFLAATIFMVVMVVVTYKFGFGLKQNQRSVMALGMLQRNMGGILVVLFAIPDMDPVVIAFVIMWGVESAPLSFIAARIFVKHAAAAEAAEVAAT
jgi:BASS family bile acid:Na+ symporter